MTLQGLTNELQKVIESYRLEVDELLIHHNLVNDRLHLEFDLKDVREKGYQVQMKEGA